MSDRIEYRGFTAVYDKKVDELISLVNICPIFSLNKTIRNIPVEVKALWDTGAVVTCIKSNLWKRLQLYSLDAASNVVLTGVGGEVVANYSIINLFLTPNLEIEYCPVYMIDFPGDAEILIGMDIINLGDFAISNTDSKTSFSFVLPPFPDRIDFLDKIKKFNS